MLGSTARAIRSMYATASTGNSPTAVSPESITAEVPSRMAFATSLASARVGSGECTIVSSIWVAVITGFPRSNALWMIRFWTSGTSAGPISTPRSPRATITASVSASTSSRTSTASAFSIFAITCACDPACVSSARRSRTSAGERMKESATKSTPVSRAHSRSATSLRVSEGIGTGTPGRLTPLCELTRPPTTTAHVARPLSTSSTRRRTSPSSMSTSWPGSSTSPITAGAIGSSPSVAASSAATRTWSPVWRTTGSASSPMRSFGPWRSAMRAIGRPTSDAISRTSHARWECPSCEPCERLNRTASTPASISARRRSRDSDAGPSVATIFVLRSPATPDFRVAPPLTPGDDVLVTVSTHYAIAAANGSLALVDGYLPSVEMPPAQLPDILAAFEPLIGRPPYLRLAKRVDDDPALRLHVFDVGDALVGDVQLPAPLRPAFEHWLAEQRGAPVPRLRATWANPGWLAEAEAWSGCDLRPHRMWPLSAVLSGVLDGETVFLKAVFPLFHHEPAITEALAREHPGAVPDLLRIDRERGWMLMRELRGEVAGDRKSVV